MFPDNVGDHKGVVVFDILLGIGLGGSQELAGGGEVLED